MFEDIGFSKVLVTGPARSGTHICAVMVAYDTGLCFLPEQAFGCNDVKQFHHIYREYDNFVAPCNALRGYIGEFGQDDTLIIIKYRPAAEIVASGRRIGGSLAHMPDATDYVERQYVLIEEQLPLLTHYVKIEHDSLSGHPLWIDGHGRARFSPRQVHRERRIGELVKICPFINEKLARYI